MIEIGLFSNLNRIVVSQNRKLSKWKKKKVDPDSFSKYYQTPSVYSLLKINAAKLRAQF